MLPRLVNLLDTRAEGLEYENAVRIPLAELAGRLHELPPPGALIRIPEDQTEAIEMLKGDREVQAFIPGAGVSSPAPGPQSFGRLRLWHCNPLVEELDCEPGPAIDLGCGAGRDSVALASLGWKVTAVDRLESSLATVAEMNRRYAPDAEIELVQANLKDQAIPRQFDLVVLAFTWFDGALDEAIRHVTPGGQLIFEMFSAEHQDRFGKPKNVPSEVAVLETLAGFEMMKYQVGWRAERHTIRGIWRNPCA